jgi:hypothetical protein
MWSLDVDNELLTRSAHEVLDTLSNIARNV